MTVVSVGKLPRDCSERELERLVRDFGRVRDIRLVRCPRFSGLFLLLKTDWNLILPQRFNGLFSLH